MLHGIADLTCQFTQNGLELPGLAEFAQTAGRSSQTTVYVRRRPNLLFIDWPKKSAPFMLARQSVRLIRACPGRPSIARLHDSGHAVSSLMLRVWPGWSIAAQIWSRSFASASRSTTVTCCPATAAGAWGWSLRAIDRRIVSRAAKWACGNSSLVDALEGGMYLATTPQQGQFVVDGSGRANSWNWSYRPLLRPAKAERRSPPGPRSPRAARAA